MDKFFFCKSLHKNVDNGKRWKSFSFTVETNIKLSRDRSSNLAIIHAKIVDGLEYD